VNFLMAMGLIFVYYLLLSAGEALGQMGWLAVGPALWGGNLIFGVAGVVLYVLLVRRGG